LSGKPEQEVQNNIIWLARLHQCIARLIIN